MSLWTIENKQKPLNLNTVTDILIVGAGITGLTLNYLLDNKDVIIIDSKVGETTLKSTAKITFLQDTLLKINKDKLEKYINSQKDAINKMVTIIKDNKIKCDLEESPSILYTNDVKEKEKLIKLKDLINAKENYEFNSLYNIYVEDTYVFNPGKYLDKLIKISNNKFYKNRYVKHTKKNGYYYVTLDNQKTIKTKKIIFACNYLPFKIKFLSILKFRIEKSYLHVFNDKKGVYNAINTKNPYESIRYYKDQKIVLKNSHLNGVELDNKKCFLDSDTKWSNCDLMSYDSLPYIGEIEKNMYVATAFNTWGMTNGTQAAYLIYDLLNSKTNPYEKIFNPKRYTCLIYMTQNSFLNSYLFFKSKFKKNYNTAYIYKNKYGIYIDEDGKEHKVNIKCPHLKCNLAFNEVEKTWDCPCHASRFDIDGNIIKGPTVDDIKINKE